MILAPELAHLACLGLIGLDLLARTVRMQALLRGLGHPLSRRGSLFVNLLADAGSALTPLRLGGEPGRVAGLLRAGVPAVACFTAIGVEVLVTWPLTLLVGVILAALWAPEWLEGALPGLLNGIRVQWLLFAAVVGLSAGAAALGWRWLRAAGHRPRRSLRRVLVYWRRMPLWPLVLSAPLTVVNVVSRTALLPILALTFPNHPPLGVMLVGSFALVYSQLFLPTPAGVGAVEFGFLVGVAGEFGPRETGLLAWWRFYSVGLTAALGLAAALRVFGWSVTVRAIRQADRRIRHRSAGR